jgi:uncharacterized membrane protein YkvA (DUF1232 family)
MMEKWKKRAKELKKEIFVLYLSYKHPRVSWLLRLFILCVVAYAFSPIDLVPDFIPILGYIDDLVLVPLGIYLALRWLPKEVVEENRIKASELAEKGKPKNWIAGILIILLYIAIAVWLFQLILNRW